MRIPIVRKIDYWLGIPLCFVLSVFNSLGRLLVGHRDQGNPQPEKILIIKLSEVGAIILSYPLLRHLRARFPQARLFYLTFQQNEEVFFIFRDLNPTSRLLTIRKRNFFLFCVDALKVIFQLRREKIDVVFDLEFFARATAILAFCVGAKKRVGFYPFAAEGLYRGNLLTHKIPYNPLAHVSEQFLAMADGVEWRARNDPQALLPSQKRPIELPAYQPDNASLQAIQGKLRALGVSDKGRLILMNPGDGIIPIREWPLERFLELARRLLEDQGTFIGVVGLKSLNKKDERFCRLLAHERCFNLTGQTAVGELLALMSLARALITSDGGLAHLAALTPIKNYVIFGPESPLVFGPLSKNTVVIEAHFPCSPCLSALNHRQSACQDNQCLKTIKAQDLLAAIQNHDGAILKGANHINKEGESYAKASCQ